MAEQQDHYPHRSAAHHIGPPVPTFPANTPVGETLDALKKHLGEWPNNERIYVLDSTNRLLGVVPLDELARTEPSKKLKDVMRADVVVVGEHAHQSHIAKLALTKGSQDIAVTDKEGKLLGVIDADQILTILHEEHIEDLLHFSGILGQEPMLDVFKARLQQLFKARIPWLLLGLGGGIITTVVVSAFTPALEREIALAFFIPVIVYMNAAVGAQTQTLFVRGIALEKVNLKKYLFQEIRVAFLIGIVTAFLLSTFAAVWVGSLTIAFIVGLSMLIGVVSSVFVGTAVPWFLHRSGKDPAVGSGPFTTMLQDFLSILIYFVVASLVLL